MSTAILGGITFVLVLAGIILVHEFGHFTAARWMKIEVEEFGIGFPPRLVTLFTWKGTKFSLNWIPLGGFVKIKGEDDPTTVGGMAAAKPWKRLIVLVAGVFMNLLTAVIAYSILFNQVGIPDTKSTVITAVEPGSPSDLAGIRPGDLVLTLAGNKVESISSLIDITYQNLGQEIIIIVEREGKSIEVPITPRAEWPEGSGPMGISLAIPLIPARSWFATLPASVSSTGRDINTLISLPGKLIAGTASSEETQLGGPRTIWNIFQAAVASDVESRQSSGGDASQRTYYTLMVIIGLSISQGTLNLLPIPALDGGRILFLIPELLFRRAIPTKYQVAINGTAFILLIALLAIFYIKDIINPVVITLP